MPDPAQNNATIPAFVDRSRWPANTYVLASSSQNTSSADGPQSYLSILSELIRSAKKLPDRSLLGLHQQAQLLISKRSNGTQIPTETLEIKKDLQKIWTADRKNVSRIMLTVTGRYTDRQGLNRPYAKIPEISRAIGNFFSVNPADQLFLSGASPDNLEQEFIKLAAFANAHRSSEALIIIKAPGFAVTENPGNWSDIFTPQNADEKKWRKIEGTLVGVVGLVPPSSPFKTGLLGERTLKKLFEKHLSKFSGVVLIVDSCYSGAWVR